METRRLLSTSIKDTIAQSCVTPLPEYNMYGGVTHDCASILDSSAKETTYFHYFLHGMPLDHHVSSRMIFALVSYILLHVRSPYHPYIEYIYRLFNIMVAQYCFGYKCLCSTE